jgi:putative peptidoglycan lipid II flippase
VAGSALQLLVQLPSVRTLVPALRPTIDTASAGVRVVLRNFGPALLGRGVVQISAYVDTILASLLPVGSVAALANAQLLYTLPVSLFGMSVAAAELPEMSGVADGAERGALRSRLNDGLRQIAYFVVPSAVGFLALGDVIAAAILQTGRFTYEDAVFVWTVLGGYAIGLLASTLGRLYSSTFHALRDTRTPLRFAVFRVVLATGLGYVAAIVLPPALGVSPRWGAAGLTAASGLCGWIELALLRRTLNRRLEASTGLPIALSVRLWASALLGAAVGWGIKLALPLDRPIIVGVLVLVPYGLVYAGATLAVGVPEARTALRRLGRLAGLIRR